MRGLIILFLLTGCTINPDPHSILLPDSAEYPPVYSGTVSWTITDDVQAVCKSNDPTVEGCFIPPLRIVTKPPCRDTKSNTGRVQCHEWIHFVRHWPQNHPIKGVTDEGRVHKSR